MRGVIIAIVVLLFALVSAQSSARTVVRAHANASANAFDPNNVEEASTNDAPASPRRAPQGSSMFDPADDRGAELRDRGVPPRLVLPTIRSLRQTFPRHYEAAPAHALLKVDVPPPRD